MPAPEQPVNAIPGEAVAHCQLRFVVGTRPGGTRAGVRAHLDAHGFAQVEVAVTLAGPRPGSIPEPVGRWAQRRSPH